MKFDTNYKIYMWNMSMSDFYLHNLNLLVSMVTNFENKQNYKNGHIFVNFKDRKIIQSVTESIIYPLQQISKNFRTSHLHISKYGI